MLERYICISGIDNAQIVFICFCFLGILLLDLIGPLVFLKAPRIVVKRSLSSLLKALEWPLALSGT